MPARPYAVPDLPPLYSVPDSGDGPDDLVTRGDRAAIALLAGYKRQGLGM